MAQQPTISIVVPVYNEGEGLTTFHASLLAVLDAYVPDAYEVIYCNDGSKDNTGDIAKGLCEKDKRIKLIQLSKNFGKENALTAGISFATGEAILTLDGDGQHPVELIPQFIAAWKAGAQVVIGVRDNDAGETWTQHMRAQVFYKIMNRLSKEKLIAGATDYRLIDRAVQEAFLELRETDRITRGLIDWLGFKREYIHFKANAREFGAPTYSRRQLIRLATNSLVSFTPTPLFLFGYLGVAITALSFVVGSVIFLEQILLEDPLNWNFSGPAMLSIFLLFLIGIVLMSQGLLSLYISHMHSQSKQRPLFVINFRDSAGVQKQHKS